MAIRDIDLVHPFPTPPAPGEAIAVAPGILWMRLPLPFRLDHVNIYAIEDGEGWAIVDAGIGSATTREHWERLLAGPLAGRPLTRLIVTHYHPDHVGAAGWLAERHGLDIEMSATDYLESLVLRLDPAALEADPYRSFYTRHGLDDATAQRVMGQGHDYLRMVSSLPRTYRRVVAGETLTIGARTFEVMTGGGHAPEQIMLFSAAERLFLSADQVLAKITPNVGLSARDPDGDPLGIFLRSLDSLATSIPPDALVLPGHNLPFIGLPGRALELVGHHGERCAEIVAACRDRPRSGAELVPIIFHRPLDPHQTGFALSELLAHVNYLKRQGSLLATGDEGDGIERVRAA